MLSLGSQQAAGLTRSRQSGRATPASNRDIRARFDGLRRLGSSAPSGHLRSRSGRAFNWLAARPARPRIRPASRLDERSRRWLSSLAAMRGGNGMSICRNQYYLQVSVTRPGPTPLEPNEPPYPLDIQFSGFAVRLGANFRSTTTQVFELVPARLTELPHALSSSGLPTF